MLLKSFLKLFLKSLKELQGKKKATDVQKQENFPHMILEKSVNALLIPNNVRKDEA